MASGRLAALDLTNANTDTLLYTVPASKTTSFSLILVNRSASIIKVRVALTTSNSISNSDYIAYDSTIYPNDQLERSGLVLATGQYVYVRTNTVGVNAMMWGFEE